MASTIEVIEVEIALAPVLLGGGRRLFENVLVNNLKDVSVEIPERRLTVFAGLSGSGKSSLPARA